MIMFIIRYFIDMFSSSMYRIKMKFFIKNNVKNVSYYVEEKKDFYFFLIGKK